MAYVSLHHSRREAIPLLSVFAKSQHSRHSPRLGQIRRISNQRFHVFGPGPLPTVPLVRLGDQKFVDDSEQFGLCVAIVVRGAEDLLHPLHSLGTQNEHRVGTEQRSNALRGGDLRDGHFGKVEERLEQVVAQRWLILTVSSTQNIDPLAVSVTHIGDLDEFITDRWTKSAFL